MSKTTVVEHHVHHLTPDEDSRIGRLARGFLDAHPEIRLENPFKRLRARHFDDRPTLHLDDASAITGMEYFPENVFMQDRARLRADTGDFVVSATEACHSFDRYCEETLALGRPQWIRVKPDNPLKLAAGCWIDRQTRETLVALLEKGRFSRIHPYMGNFHVWSLAQLLSKSARSQLEVLAPPPGLTRKVNDKAWFTSVVARVLGEQYIPKSFPAHNFATLAMVVRQFVENSQHIVIKLPDSAGGKGNLLIDTARYRNLPLGAIRTGLREELRALHWRGNSRLLISCWEEPVISSPSAQLWIPPCGDGNPVIEGFYDQNVEGARGDFLGSAPATFPVVLESDMARCAALLGHLFQRMGYIGRCSFDLLLVGPDLQNCQPKLVECNGRWGGTSGPMSLMNRWFGDWTIQPYVSRKFRIPGLEKLEFDDLESAFRDVLFNARSKTGWLAFLNASGLRNAQINVLTLGESIAQAQRRMNDEVPHRLHKIGKQP